MRTIWEQRNLTVFSGTKTTPERILSLASSSILTVPENWNNEDKEDNQSAAQIDLLYPAPTNDYTIYTDGAWNLGRGGWGFLIFDRNNLLMFECGNTSSISAMQAEAVAVLKAIQAFKDTGLAPRNPTASISLCSDCSNLVDSINNLHGRREQLMDWRAERLVHCILDEIRTLPTLTLSHLPRSQNKEAHNLAAHGLTFQEQVRGFQFPSFKPP